jgi:hypothetical protein
VTLVMGVTAELSLRISKFGEAEVGELQIQGQPGLYRETLSQKNHPSQVPDNS